MKYCRLGHATNKRNAFRLHRNDRNVHRMLVGGIGFAHVAPVLNLAPVVCVRGNVVTSLFARFGDGFLAEFDASD